MHSKYFEYTNISKSILLQIASYFVLPSKRHIFISSWSQIIQIKYRGYCLLQNWNEHLSGHLAVQMTEILSKNLYLFILNIRYYHIMIWRTCYQTVAWLHIHQTKSNITIGCVMVCSHRATKQTFVSIYFDLSFWWLDNLLFICKCPKQPYYFTVH